MEIVHIFSLKMKERPFEENLLQIWAYFQLHSGRSFIICYKMRPQFPQPIKYPEVFKAAFKMLETTPSETQRNSLCLTFGKVVKTPSQKFMVFLHSTNPGFICVKRILVEIARMRLAGAAGTPWASGEGSGGCSAGNNRTWKQWTHTMGFAC